MKVIQILAGNEDGGLEKHTIELSSNLVKNNIKVFVIAHKDFKNRFDKKGIEFIPLDLTKSRNNPIILHKLYKVIKKISPDIIHSQANKATAMIANIKPFLSSIFIATLHSDKTNLKSFEKADFVISVSDTISKRLINKNKKTIYNGIKLEKQKNTHLFNLPKDKFILCTVARFSKVKRLELILKAIKNLDIHLALVGDGEEKSKLQKMASDLKIENKITFFGYLSNEKASQIISISSLFVLCSDKEGFPYTFIESMLFKTPFISTPVSDIPKFLIPKYIFEFSNFKQMEKKISYIKDNYGIVLNDFKQVFDYANKNFTIENMVKENIQIYEKMLGISK